MSDPLGTHIRASRLTVPRTRGALGGLLLIVLGAWAALVPFFGAYIGLKTTPMPDSTWHWTAARGWLEVLPGAAAVLGGLILLVSANRVVTSFGGWLAAAAGGWLIVGLPLAGVIGFDNPPTANPADGQTAQALSLLLTFFAIGGAILLFAALAIGRLSVHGIGDVRAADRRARAGAASGEEFTQYRTDNPWATGAPADTVGADAARTDRAATTVGGDRGGHGTHEAQHEA